MRHPMIILLFAFGMLTLACTSTKHRPQLAVTPSSEQLARLVDLQLDSHPDLLEVVCDLEEVLAGLPATDPVRAFVETRCQSAPQAIAIEYGCANENGELLHGTRCVTEADEIGIPCDGDLIRFVAWGCEVSGRVFVAQPSFF